MRFNTPLPQPLPKECAKAAKIFQSFVDSRNNGLDGVIPRSVLQNARGFAIFTVVKAGFVLSARAGSGVVIARKEDGSWTAPSAIGTAGLGFGSQAGAEVTDFLVVLNTRAAIRSFMAAGSLTLGGNLSIALGPLGRNGEASGSVTTGGKLAAMYSYSKTKGLFGGISIEGSVIVERQDANAQAYESPVTVQMLLSGIVPTPPWAEPLIKTLDTCTRMPGQRDWIHDQYNQTPEPAYAFAGPTPQPSPSPSTHSRTASFLRRKKDKDKPSFPPPHWGTSKEGGSYFLEDAPYSTSREFDDQSLKGFDVRFEDKEKLGPSNLLRSRSNSVANSLVASKTGTLVDDLDDPFDNTQSTSISPLSRNHVLPRVNTRTGRSSLSKYSQVERRSPSPSLTSTYGADNLYLDSPIDVQRRLSQSPFIMSKPKLTRSLLPGEGIGRAIALYDFKAVEDGDLSFSKGDVITVIKKSDSTHDWWTGRVDNREGIFPANFVEVV